MPNELLKELQLEDLTGSARELAEIVGMEAFARLVEVYGGSSNLYIPKADQLVLPIRDKLIQREYNGGNVYALSRKWGLTERYVREIVKEKAKELRIAPGPGQMSLWD